MAPVKRGTAASRVSRMTEAEIRKLERKFAQNASNYKFVVKNMFSSEAVRLAQKKLDQYTSEVANLLVEDTTKDRDTTLQKFRNFSSARNRGREPYMFMTHGLSNDLSGDQFLSNIAAPFFQSMEEKRGKYYVILRRIKTGLGQYVASLPDTTAGIESLDTLLKIKYFQSLAQQQQGKREWSNIQRQRFSDLAIRMNSFLHLFSVPDN